MPQNGLRCASNQQSPDCASSVRTDQYQISAPLARHPRQSMPGILQHHLSPYVQAGVLKLFGLFFQSFEGAFFRFFQQQGRVREEERIQPRYRQEFRSLRPWSSCSFSYHRV
jgi:hypothetical protein